MNTKLTGAPLVYSREERSRVGGTLLSLELDPSPGRVGVRTRLTRRLTAREKSAPVKLFHLDLLRRRRGGEGKG